MKSDHKKACLVSLFLALMVHAQQSERVAAGPETQGAVQPVAPGGLLADAAVPRLVKFSGQFKDRIGRPLTGVVGVAFALDREREGGLPVWLEMQNVECDEQGRYTALLGATRTDGLPLEVFTAAEPRWLGVQVQIPGEEEQARVLLVSVPYALRAADAETLGGKPLSAFLLAESPPMAGAGTSSTASARAGAGDTKNLISGRPSPVYAGSPNYIARWDSAMELVTSEIYQTGTGNIGIGTTTGTAAKLHIYGTGVAGNGPELRIQDSSGNNPYLSWYGIGGRAGLIQQAGAALDFFADTGKALMMRGNGGGSSLTLNTANNLVFTGTNVGIGVSPTAKLHVSGPGAELRIQDSSGTNPFLSWHGTDGRVGLIQQNLSALDVVTNPGFALMLRGNSGGSSLTLNTANNLVFAGANVGLGSAGSPAPTEKLEVAGNVKVSGSGNGLIFPDGSKQTTAATGNLYVAKAGDTMTGTLTLPANGLVAGTNQLVLSGGNVGIGAAGPGQRLEVAGNVKLTGSGNGIIFPDVTIQTTACGALAFGALAPSSSANAGATKLNAGALGGLVEAGAGGRPSIPGSSSPLGTCSNDSAGLLLEAVNQQQAQIRELQAEIEALKARLNTLAGNAPN